MKISELVKVLECASALYEKAGDNEAYIVLRAYANLLNQYKSENLSWFTKSIKKQWGLKALQNDE